MRVNREQLLSRLQSTFPGVSLKEIVAQSSCFVFREGQIFTFNDEIACSVAFPFDGMEGAVPAKPLAELLSKLQEDELDITVEDGKMIVKGKGRKAEITMETEISLPIDLVEQPSDWEEFSGEALEALSIVHTVSSSSKDSDFSLTCVHITPDLVEACDNFQACRYPVKTGFKESCLVRGASIRNIPGLGMNKVSESKAWVHFENSAGLRLSVRRWSEEYHDLSAIFEGDGEKLVLPGSLSEAVEKANIFSMDGNGKIQIILKGSRMLIRGEGASGKFEEQRQVDFKGNISFMIVPKILLEIAEKSTTCGITAEKLKVTSANFVYVTCLGAL